MISSGHTHRPYNLRSTKCRDRHDGGEAGGARGRSAVADEERKADRPRHGRPAEGGQARCASSVNDDIMWCIVWCAVCVCTSALIARFYMRTDVAPQRRWPPTKYRRRSRSGRRPSPRRTTSSRPRSSSSDSWRGCVACVFSFVCFRCVLCVCAWCAPRRLISVEILCDADRAALRVGRFHAHSALRMNVQYEDIS